MKENFSIKSKIISGTVTKTDCENGANIVIDIKIHGDISPTALCAHILPSGIQKS